MCSFKTRPDFHLQTGHSIVSVPKDAIAGGDCGNETQQLTLQWPKNKNSSHLILDFQKNDTLKHFMITAISVELAADETMFPDITSKYWEKLGIDGSIVFPVELTFKFPGSDRAAQILQVSVGKIWVLTGV